MILLTVQFDQGRTKNYKRLFDVFKTSVQKNIPGVHLVNIKIKAPERQINIARNLTYNTEKLKIWTDFIETHPGQNIILADCDMLCTKNPSETFLKNFDIGITFKTCEVKKSPMNGGIVFVKSNPKSIQFMKTWLDVNNQMYRDKLFHAKWKNKYLGMNQAAFGYVHEVLKPDINMIKLPTIKYNAVDCDWKSVDDQTYFIHIKSELRRAVLMNIEPTAEFRYCMSEWYKYQEMIPDPPVEVKQPKKRRKKIKYRRPRRRGGRL